MENKFNLLPDSGLPIEAEVERHIENLVNKCRTSLASIWEDRGETEAFRSDFCELMRKVFTERYGSRFEEQIRLRRGNETH